MTINKIDNLIFIDMMKERLQESTFNIDITKSVIDGNVNFNIDFNLVNRNLGTLEYVEQINQLTITLIDSFNKGLNYPIIKLTGKIDEFLEKPESLLFELFNNIEDEYSRINIYKTLYSSIAVTESLNEATNRLNIGLYPGKANEIIKVLLKEELNKEATSIVELHGIIGYLSKVKPEDRHFFQEELFNILQMYEPVLIKEDNNKNRDLAVRDKIAMYIKQSHVDKDTWQKFRQFFPVGKNNAHLYKPTENDLFLVPEYKLHNIVLPNLSIMAYYDNLLSTKSVSTMLVDITKVLNKKEHDFLKKVKVGILDSNDDDQSLWVKIDNEENQEKVLKEVKTVFIGLMDAYQNCLEMADKERNHYLDKACDTILLGLKLSQSEKISVKEAKPYKI